VIVNDAHPIVGILDNLERLEDLESLIGANLLLDGSQKTIFAYAEISK